MQFNSGWFHFNESRDDQGKDILEDVKSSISIVIYGSILGFPSRKENRTKQIQKLALSTWKEVKLLTAR
jgi:hypothetical protein